MLLLLRFRFAKELLTPFRIGLGCEQQLGHLPLELFADVLGQPAGILEVDGTSLYIGGRRGSPVTGKSSQEACKLPKQCSVLQPTFARERLRRRVSAKGGQEPPTALSEDSRQLRVSFSEGFVRIDHKSCLCFSYRRTLRSAKHPTFSLPKADDTRQGSHHHDASNVVRRKAEVSPVQDQISEALLLVERGGVDLTPSSPPKLVLPVPPPPLLLSFLPPSSLPGMQGATFPRATAIEEEEAQVVLHGFVLQVHGPRVPPILCSEIADSRNRRRTALPADFCSQDPHLT